jgi:hypothetical protein
MKLTHKFAEMTPDKRPQDPVCTGNLNPDVVVVKSAEDRA